MDTLERTRRPVLGLVVVLALAGCSTGTTPSPTSTGGPSSTAPGATPEPTTGGSPTPPTPSAEPISTPSVTASAAPGVSLPPPPTGAWRPVASQVAVSGAQLQDVVWTGTRFEAVGDGEFLDSTDGRTWRSRDAGDPAALPTRIASGPSGFVAIGTIDGRLASWASPNGVQWSWHIKNFPASAASVDRVTVTDVVATPSGWLAVGREDPACAVECQMTPVRGLVWTSTDGLTWKRVTGQTALENGGINAVAAGGPGFVAVGIASGHAAVWLSPDGHAWSRVADSATFGAPAGSDKDAVVVANGVAAGHGSIVVVGMAFALDKNGTQGVMAWRSADGTAWSTATVDHWTFGQAFAVAATQDRFLMTGPSGEDSCLGGIWSSTDGASWACEASDPAFEGFGPYAAAGSPTIEVAVGLTSAGWDSSGGAGMPGSVWWRAAP